MNYFRGIIFISNKEMQEVLKKGKSMIRVLKQINVGCFCVKLIPILSLFPPKQN
ncbi:hypothetical protein CRE_05418 [Caenorhabditis remanei]|uniref:Uncharacterized protein n=1 Tax=Caenorhabditis remanei TaxID=31234 RepID=E3M0G0_CAERE|nr:hypothetical protein CRE_05418 [Caenorhabditis remanei]